MWAGGGSATVSHGVTNKRTYYYTSGATGETIDEAGRTSIKITTNGNDRFSLSEDIVSHDDMKASATTDTVTIKVTNLDSTSLTNSDSKSITNNVNASYDVPTITSYSYSIFSSDGGSKSPTVTYT